MNQAKKSDQGGRGMRVDIDAAAKMAEAALELMGTKYPKKTMAAFRKSFAEAMPTVETSMAGRQCSLGGVHIVCGGTVWPWPLPINPARSDGGSGQSSDEPQRITYQLTERGPVDAGGGPTICIPIFGTPCFFCLDFECEG